MKILVTGGAGFIGSHLTLSLLKEGHEVTVIDDLSLGQEKFLNESKTLKGFKFLKNDLLNFEAILEACRRVDQVWHMAANSDIAAGGKKTDVDLKIGTIATYNVLEAARVQGVKEFIFASTSAIYGETTVKPTPENYGPLLPISFYGASKLACEALATAFAHNYGMKIWIFRFANIVGSHTTHGAIHDFIKKLKLNPEELEILGNGKQSKSYLHVNDCVKGMMFGLKNSNEPVNLFNLSGEGSCSVDQIATSVISKVNPKARKKFTGGDRGWPGDVAQVLLDGSKLQKMGFKASFNSAQAVAKAVDDIIGDLETGMS